MATFTSSVLTNRGIVVLENAAEAPVTITKRGVPAFVVITHEEYERLMQAAGVDYLTSETLAEAPRKLGQQTRLARNQ
jgi:prevent-host-death family protein